jgi:bifunctional non-homologous end joining protein LigD
VPIVAARLRRSDGVDGLKEVQPVRVRTRTANDLCGWSEAREGLGARLRAGGPYVGLMSSSLRPRILSQGFIEPCQPSAAPKPPSGPKWLHEIKYDGFRLMAWREGDRVRLYVRGGFDWVDRYPAIAAAVGSLKVESCFIDGEVVVCDDAGRQSFEMLRSRQHDRVAFLYAFDLLALDGKDLRREPLETRKATLASLVRQASVGIAVSEQLEGDGENIFRHVCKLGLEGIVSKRRDSPYKSGPSLNWIKSKNPASAAGLREAAADWAK